MFHACYKEVSYRFVKFKHFISFLKQKLKESLYVSSLVSSASSRHMAALTETPIYFIKKSAMFHAVARSTN
jgi:hypothetical protein